MHNHTHVTQARKRGIWAILILFLACTAVCAKPALATAYKVNRAMDNPISVGTAKFVSNQYTVSGRYTYRIRMTQNGKSKVIVNDASAAFVTNGRYLYYSKYVSGPNANYQNKRTLYRLDLRSNARKKLATGLELIPLACSGTYLYYGTDNYAEGVNLYAINVKTKAKRHMVNYVGQAHCGGGRVVTSTNTGAPGNYPIYLFKTNGTGKKKLANGMGATIKGKYIYYTSYKMGSNYQSLFRVYRTNLSGSAKKAMTGWVSYSSIPTKYLP